MYVVTFDPRPVAGPGAIAGLRRMPLEDAQRLVTGAHPRQGRIVDADTLEVLVVTFLSVQLAKARTNLTVSTELWAAGHLTTGELAEAVEAFNSAEAAHLAGRYPDTGSAGRREPEVQDRVTYRGPATELIAEGELGTVAGVHATGCLYVLMDDGGRVKGPAQSWAPLREGQGYIIKAPLDSSQARA